MKPQARVGSPNCADFELYVLILEICGVILGCFSKFHGI